MSLFYSNTHVRKARDQNMNSLHIELHMYLLGLRFHHYPDLAQDSHNGSRFAIEKLGIKKKMTVGMHHFLT